MRMPTSLRVIVFFAVSFLATMTGAMQAAASNCLAVARNERPVMQAAYSEAALADDEVRLTFLGHASFLIESPAGVRVVTDYTGWSGGLVPDAVTMNRAHTSHYTDSPDPAIAHVLRGWNPEGGPAVHDITIKDMRIRNVTTDIRGGFAGRVADGNSIFVFEAAGLCIGHLGHLHHALDASRLGLVGRLDIVMVPVDGGYTMGHPEMLAVLKELRARVVIPMHYFGPATLSRFVASMGGAYRLEVSSTPERVFSLDTLPDEPRLVVLPGN
jgi:L-ascorbate metabolism protein UlaG (beta-lactamase superfamily)